MENTYYLMSCTHQFKTITASAMLQVCKNDEIEATNNLNNPLFSVQYLIVYFEFICPVLVSVSNYFIAVTTRVYLGPAGVCACNLLFYFFKFTSPF